MFVINFWTISSYYYLRKLKFEFWLQNTFTLMSLTLLQEQLKLVWFYQFCRQLSLDCMFVQSQRIIEYSLLVRLQFRAPKQLKSLELLIRGTLWRVYFLMMVRLSNSALQWWWYERSRSLWVLHCCAYMGIIDILQKYNVQKKLDHPYKSTQHDPMTIYVVETNLYVRRFSEFLMIKILMCCWLVCVC